MRILPGLLLLAGVAAGEGRTIPEILADHAQASGDVALVRTLKSTATLRNGVTIEGVETAWRLPDQWLRRVPSPNGPARYEHFVGGVALTVDPRMVGRYRPNLQTTRGAYYLAKALSEPFPLHRYMPDGKGLEVAFAEGHEVLVTPKDVYGVHALYMLDAKTHLLVGVRYEEEPNKPFVNITLEQHRKVGGVVLPHSRFIAYRFYEEAERLVPHDRTRWEQVIAWEVNPDLSRVSLDLPTPAEKKGKGFERRVLRTGPDPHEIAAGDLDGDGKTDIAIACEGGLYVHFGGDQERPRKIALGKGHHRGLAIEDLDRDGRPELITASNVEPSQRYFLVTFDAKREPETAVLFGAPGVAVSLEAVDLDRDGIGDLVACGSRSRTLDVRFGNGGKGMRIAGIRWPLSTPEHPGRTGRGLAVGDLNGDELSDIAVADGERVVLFMGNLQLGFEPLLEVAAPRPVGVRIADLNGDGRADLLVASSSPMVVRDLSIFLGTGGSIKPVPPVAAGFDDLCDLGTGDFDGDGITDVVITAERRGEMRVLHGDGAGGFRSPERYTSGRGAFRLCVTDVDGDLRADVLVTNRHDDTVSVFRNSGEFLDAVKPAPARADAIGIGMETPFALEGLSDPFDFVGEFRLPLRVPEPSGIASLGRDQLVLVSDDSSALFRATLDRDGKRLLVGPAVPLHGLEGERLDLEGAAFDPWSGNLFLACESDSSVLRATLTGHVLRRVATGVPHGDNDGIEALALRRLRDGTPLLYVFRERLGMSLGQPPVHVFGMTEEPFALVPRGEPLKLPHSLIDQTGAAVVGDRMFVLSRMGREVVEMGFDGDGFAGEAKTASYRELVVDRLGIRYDQPPFYGMAEGVAVDAAGDLFLLFDNNGRTVGIEGKNRGAEGRLLWFRNRGGKAKRVRADRVVVRQILVSEEKAARECLRRALEGEDFDALAKEFRAEKVSLPPLLRIVRHPLRARQGERQERDLPAALARLALALEVGETDLCEYHETESPRGWRVVQRIE